MPPQLRFLKYPRAAIESTKVSQKLNKHSVHFMAFQTSDVRFYSHKQTVLIKELAMYDPVWANWAQNVQFGLLENRSLTQQMTRPTSHGVCKDRLRMLSQSHSFSQKMPKTQRGSGFLLKNEKTTTANYYNP